MTADHLVMITQLIWIIWTLLSAVLKRLLKLITHSLVMWGARASAYTTLIISFIYSVQHIHWKSRFVMMSSMMSSCWWHHKNCAATSNSKVVIMITHTPTHALGLSLSLSRSSAGRLTILLKNVSIFNNWGCCRSLAVCRVPGSSS